MPSVLPRRVRCTRERIEPVFPDRLAEARAALAGWSERYGPVGLDERLKRSGLRELDESLDRWPTGERGQPADRREGCLARFVDGDVLADWGSERELIWEALAQLMIASAKEQEVPEADEKARNRKTMGSLGVWQAETLEGVAAEAIERKLLNRRSPPQPGLGILLHGARGTGHGARV